MASASDNTRAPAPHGPVTQAIAAMRSDEGAPPRRALLKAAGAVLVGAILGTAPYKTSRDLTAVAEAYIDDAAQLGMRLLIGPDGNVWRDMAIDISAERVAAQDAHWHKLNKRPPLLRAVYAAVEGGYRTA